GLTEAAKALVDCLTEDTTKAGVAATENLDISLGLSSDGFVLNSGVGAQSFGGELEKRDEEVSAKELWPKNAPRFEHRFVFDYEPLSEEEIAEIEASEAKDEPKRKPVVLGSGGQGSVYLITDVSLNQKFILKVLKPQKVDERSAVARLLREGREGVKKEYQGIPLAPTNCFVEISGLEEIGYGNVEQAVGLVQAYVDGPEFADVIAQHNGRKREYLETHSTLSKELKAERDALVDIWFRVLEVVGHAHDSGDVHRDIKPANIRLLQLGDHGQGESPINFVEALKDSRPFLLDLGLIKRGREREEFLANATSDDMDVKLTQDRSILGSLRYMSPEQLANSSTVGPATDLYACGVMLYEILTGEPVQFKGENEWMKERLEVIEHGPRCPSPKELDPTIDPVLDAIVMKCLARKVPGEELEASEKEQEVARPIREIERYGSITEIRDEIERYYKKRGEVVEAYVERPSPNVAEGFQKTLYLTSNWIARHPKISSAVTAGLAIGALTIAGIAASVKATRDAVLVRLNESDAAITQKIQAEEFTAVTADLDKFSTLAFDYGFDELGQEAETKLDAIECLPLLEKAYEEYGLSLINPMRNSAVRPQSLVETEKLLAWVISDPETRPDSPAVFEVPGDWHEDFATKLFSILEDAEDLTPDYKSEIRDKVGVMLYAQAVDRGTPSLYINRTDEEVRAALKLYDEIEMIWGTNSERAVAIGRENAWRLLDDAEAEVKLMELNSILEDRLLIDSSDARSLLIEAMFELNSGLEATDFEAINVLLSKCEEKDSTIIDEYNYHIAKIKVLIEIRSG
ncbi:MAG: serine/threonine protein kinase, partial [Bdellovibrionales bacterium]|nr:serine/threonine protein kinase [Bdellovibrionales bacterium]